MGYYTSHELKVKDPKDYETIKTELETLSGYESMLFDDSCKWYEQNENCLKVSSNNPDITFAIEGDGEESGDQWQRVYKSGAMIREIRATPFIFPDL